MSIDLNVLNHVSVSSSMNLGVWTNSADKNVLEYKNGNVTSECSRPSKQWISSIFYSNM